MIEFINNYPYLILTGYFFTIWLIAFTFRKRNAAEIIIISLFGALLGPFVQYMHLQDWWVPNFIFPTIIKFEDLLFGFSIAGVASVLYEECFHMTELRRKDLIPSKKYMTLVLSLGFFLLFGLFFLFNLHSFLTSIIASAGVGLLIVYKRHDLLKPMILCATILVLISFPIYLFLLHSNNLLFEQQWILGNLSGYKILRIPVEELGWYFVVGIAFSCIYEFVYGIKFIKK